MSTTMPTMAGSVKYSEPDKCVETTRVLSRRPILTGPVTVGPVTTPPDTSRPPPSVEPIVKFDNQDLAELNEEWQDCAGQIESIDGYLDYEETDYTWETSTRDDSSTFGMTSHGSGNTRVTIFSVAIRNNGWGIHFDHLLMQVVIHEHVHTIQGGINVFKDSKFDREVEAHNLSCYWYKAIFKQDPPLLPYTQKQIDAAKENSEYIELVKEIDRLRAKIIEAGGSTATESDDFYRLMQRLGELVPQRIPDRNYGKEELECQDQ